MVRGTTGSPTLDIDEKRIRNYHSTKKKLTGTPQQVKRGKVPSRAVPNYIKDSVHKYSKHSQNRQSLLSQKYKQRVHSRKSEYDHLV